MSGGENALAGRPPPPSGPWLIPELAERVATLADRELHNPKLGPRGAPLGDEMARAMDEARASELPAQARRLTWLDHLELDGASESELDQASDLVSKALSLMALERAARGWALAEGRNNVSNPNLPNLLAVAWTELSEAESALALRMEARPLVRWLASCFPGAAGGCSEGSGLAADDMAWRPGADGADARAALRARGMARLLAEEGSGGPLGGLGDLDGLAAMAAPGSLIRAARALRQAALRAWHGKRLADAWSREGRLVLEGAYPELAARGAIAEWGSARARRTDGRGWGWGWAARRRGPGRGDGGAGARAMALALGMPVEALLGMGPPKAGIFHALDWDARGWALSAVEASGWAKEISSTASPERKRPARL